MKNKNISEKDIELRSAALQLVGIYEPGKHTTEKRLELADTYFGYLKNGDVPEVEEK